ncbi:hypothetical protein JST97_02665 [bacterium]|nr:hypothetical protein [bacterium]
MAVPVGTTRDFEFVADNPCDWPLMMGVTQKGTKAQQLLPELMPMGETGMDQMSKMQAEMNDSSGKPI